MTTPDATLVQGLRAGMRGPVLVASDPGYDETRAIWNAMIDRRPALIARCIGVSDVLAGLRCAKEHSMALSMRGGGHNIAGLAVGPEIYGGPVAGRAESAPEVLEAFRRLAGEAPPELTLVGLMRRRGWARACTAS
jgi:hypothetical protein